MLSDQAFTNTYPVHGVSKAAEVYRSITRYLSASYVIPTAKRTMCSVPQHANLHLLAEQVLAFGVPGDLVELGCYAGDTTRTIAKAWQQLGMHRGLHVYDDFKFDPKGMGDVREQFIASFAQSGLTLPTIHMGDLHSMLHDELPEKIAFAHIDLGFEEEPRLIAQLVRKSLENIYPRMTPGSVCVLMDYHDPTRTLQGWDCSPGVKLACDRFFADKQEKMQVLFGGEYSHGFFRRLPTNMA